MSETASGLAALLKILRYLEDTQRRDFESRTPRDQKNHIYAAVMIVREWMAANMALSDRDQHDAAKHHARQAAKEDDREATPIK
jgi:hypothetical protein